MRHIIYLFSFLLVNGTFQVYGSCTIQDSVINGDNAGLYLIQTIKRGDTLDEHCFSLIIQDLQVKRKETLNVIAEVLSRINKGKGVGNEILFSAYRNESIYTNTKIWNIIKNYWLLKNKSSHEAFVKLVEGGFPAQADTLFTIFDNEMQLDMYDLSRWAQVKNITGDYYKIPELLCRCIDAEPRLQIITLNQFQGILNNLTIEQADSVLNLFLKQCDILTLRKGKNRQQFFDWLLKTWGRLGLYHRQINYVNKTFFGDRRGEVLLNAAQEYYKNRDYKYAALLAAAAFEGASGKTKDSCALIAYESWVRLNNVDSALIWIEKTTKLSLNDKAVGVVLYQSTGEFDKALELIESLPYSLIRDTLQIRQNIFKHDLKSAHLLLRKSDALNKKPSLYLIWKLRLLLFDSSLAAFQNLVDSLRDIPQWQRSTELLQYRYWIQKLNFQQDMLALWATIEYNNFIGRPQDSGLALCSSSIFGIQRTALIIEAAKEIIKQSPQKAVSFFEMCNDTSSKPEYVYYKAEAFYLSGEISRAHELLELLMLEHPDDIHSGKARLLLSQIMEKEN